MFTSSSSRRRDRAAFLLLALGSSGCRDVFGFERASGTSGAPNAPDASTSLLLPRIEPLDVDFGRTRLGQSPSSRAIAVTAETPLEGLTIAIEGEGFSSPQTDCKRCLTRGEGCTVRVAFAPRKQGRSTGTVRVQHSLGLAVIPLVGVGTIPVQVSVLGDGGGELQLQPEGATCRGSCVLDSEFPYAELRAVDDGDAFFTGWEVGCAGKASSCSFDPQTVREVSARFRRSRTFALSSTGEDAATSVAIGIRSDVYVSGYRTKGFQRRSFVALLNGDVEPVFDKDLALGDGVEAEEVLDSATRSLSLFLLLRQRSAARFGSRLVGYTADVDTKLNETAAPPGADWLAVASLRAGAVVVAGTQAERAVVQWDAGRTYIDRHPRFTSTQARSVCIVSEDQVVIAGASTDDAGRGVLAMQVHAAEALPRWSFVEGNPAAPTGLSQANALARDSLGNLILGGILAADEGGRTYLYLAKLTASGNKVWSKVEGAPSGLSAVNSVAVTVDDDIVTAGYMQTSGTEPRPVLRRYSPDGELRWERALPPMPAAAAAAHMKSVAVDTDGGIVVAGQSPENGGDIWVRKYFQ